MRTKTARIVHASASLALIVTAAGAAVGCGNEKADNLDTEVRDSVSASDFNARARQVADAWDGSQAAELWRRGYYPMAEAVQLPEGGFQNATDKRAYEDQNFVLRGALPATPHKDGQVTWASGESLTLPLITAQKAYETLDRNSGDGPHLTVTVAQLGKMTLATSRGPASIPAWLFTLEGYGTPLRRAAISPSKLPEPPIRPAGQVPSGALWQISRLVAITSDGRSVKLVAVHGSCDDGPALNAT